METETHQKPVMDVAPPPKAPAPNSPVPPQPPQQTVQQAVRLPEAQAVHSAPAIPGEEQLKPTEAHPSSPKDSPVPKPKSPAPRAKTKTNASKFPATTVVLTVIVMIVLAGLAIAVYSTSAK